MMLLILLAVKQTDICSVTWTLWTQKTMSMKCMLWKSSIGFAVYLCFLSMSPARSNQ